MRAEDVTPEWVKGRMASLGWTQSKVATDIGMTQDKLSRSLNGHRRFMIEELNALGRLLCEPEPEIIPDADALQIATRIAALSEAARRILEALVSSLEREALEAQGPPGGGEPAPDDGE
jgi:transcriptional regulator with XRE-family HTH domain